MKKTGTIIFILSTAFPTVYGQTVDKEIKTDKRLRTDKELISELLTVIKKTDDSLHFDFNTSDTLYIIRGVDIQDRVGYGWMWNQSKAIAYVDSRKRTKNKVISNPLIEVTTNYQGQFSDIIGQIEKWDILGINNYVDEQNSVLSGILSWYIIRVRKQNGEYSLDLTTVKNFSKKERASR